MGCTALDPNMTTRDQALFLNEHMPAGLFGGVGVDVGRVAWRLSPEPFWLAPQTFAAIERLGPDLLRFYRAPAPLYQRSARGTAPPSASRIRSSNSGGRIASKAISRASSAPTSS